MNVEKINDLNEIFFPNLNWRFHVDSTAFSIGSFGIQWYSLIIVTGIMLAMLYCFPRMKKFGIDSDRAADAVIGGVIGGIIGARAYYVIWNWEEYQGDIKAILNTRNGGLAIYGGIIGALIVGLTICKIRKVKFLPMLDIVSIGFLIGQGVGRWGNYTNQEAFGTNTDSLFAMTGGTIQNTILRMGNPELAWDKAVHPCFLYESAWCLLGFLVLAFLSKRRKYDGQIFLMYLAWYGAERFIVEGLRTDSLMIGNLRVSQLLSALIFLGSAAVQLVMLSKYKRDPEKYILYVRTEESRLLLEERRREKIGISSADAKVSADDEDVSDEFSILGDDDDYEEITDFRETDITENANGETTITEDFKEE
ncbi:MAG: prolipoprotein diacylglyceryl transferase [Ruminococcus sp.]|nr:prolipoprotein diacylglyceryl transferase [Ruminococcus sp.]